MRPILPRWSLAGVSALVLLTLMAWQLAAQSLPTGGLGIDRFGLEDGLPGLFIPDLAVTGDGRLWMISSGTLTSFDGLVFESHDVADETAIARGALGGIGAGRGDTLWITTGDHLHSLVAGHMRLRAENARILRNVWQDGDGQLWVLDDEAILRLGTPGFERMVRLVDNWFHGQALVDPNSPSREGPALGLLDARLGTAWQMQERVVLGPLPLPGEWPVPPDDRRLVFTRTGPDSVEVVNSDGGRLALFPRSPERAPLLVDRRGLLWTAVPGRVEAIGVEGDVVASLEMAPDARVASMVEDGEGNLWIGTVTDGLYRISVRPVAVVAGAEGVTDGQVGRASGGPDGSVLFIDTEGRLTRLLRSRVDTIFEPTAEEGRAASAVGDRRGTLWVAGGQPQDPWLRGRTREGREILVQTPAFPLRIVEDPREDGLLWLGVYKVRPYSEPPQIDGPLLETASSARDLVVDREGVAWAVGPAGLSRISDDGVEQFLAGDGFPTGGARAIHLDEEGTLWIGTYQRGLVRYRDGRFSAIRAADGLWDDSASSILEDDAGNLWMSSNRGVHRVARQDLNDFIDGRIDRVRGRGYGASDGFRNAETSGWSAHRSPDGRMWFPTFSGVAVIDPQAVIASEQVAPHVWVRGVSAGEEVFPASARVALERGQRRVDLSYGATLLSGHEGLRYEVMLEGVDPDWVDVGAQRSMAYTALPPGRRDFRVRAVSGSGVSSAVEASIRLDVPPYFRETGAFYLVLSLVAAATLAGVYRLRIRQLYARELNLRQLVRERTADLGRSKAQTEQALATVEAQADELRSLDEAKSRFFANVSHELRTPLTLVQGPLIDVLDGRLGPTSDAVKEQVEIVLGSGRRLGELVEQLLDVARLESGELRLSVRSHDLSPLFERLASSFDALARSLRIGFEARIPDGGVRAVVDADQIEKVYGNLLANALKFTAEGGHVRFVAEVVAEELRVTVQDDGPGIPEDEGERIFERFHQVDSSSRREHGGTGLGLALVREITELHGGRVELSAPTGGGSRFTVSIPVSGPNESAGEPEAAEMPGRDRPPGFAPRSERATRSTPAPRSEAADDAPSRADTTDDATRPTVLVVEDDVELRAYLRRHLADDYRVIEAGNGEEALDEARRAAPDLVLCDVMMPVMDGEELCRAIRADPELDFLPVVMVTARSARESRLSALEGGADDYLVKPFDPEELRLRVGNLLAARRRLRERLPESGIPLSHVALDLPVRAGHEDFAEQIVAVLRARMDDEELEPKGIAKALLMSRATLYRKTEEALGGSPMDLLWSLRLEQAAQWLRETDATLSEVAYACGFKAVPHFMRRFKQRFGTTAAAYRSRQDDG